MSSPLDDGAVFANRYRIVRCMARGGMGAVYEVVHLDTARRRALKVMHPHILDSEDLRERFQREAVVAAEIESEFIVDVFDAGIDPATSMPFLCMELLRGEELSRRIRRLKRLPPHEVALFLHQTALGLDRTHAAAVVHRDLKPENLFVTEQEDGPPRIKVLDFGIAKVISDGGNSGSATLSMGTPLYMSPEQFALGRALTAASDIYALGLIAYTCLVGVPYWAEEAKAGGIFAFGLVAAKGPPERASDRARKHGVELSAEFDAWFARTTAVAPEHRFARATDATRALAQALGVSTGGEPRSTAETSGLIVAPPSAPTGGPPLPAFAGSALIAAHTPPPAIRELDDLGMNDGATLVYNTPSSPRMSAPAIDSARGQPAGSLTPGAFTPAGAALPVPFASTPSGAAGAAGGDPGLLRRRMPGIIAVAVAVVVAVAATGMAVFTGSSTPAASAPSASAVATSGPLLETDTPPVPPPAPAVASVEPPRAAPSSPAVAGASSGSPPLSTAAPRAATAPRAVTAPKTGGRRKYTQD